MRTTGKKKGKKEKFWRNHVKKHSESGLTQKDYCKNNNLSYWSFSTWKNRLKKQDNNKLVEVAPDIISSLNDKTVEDFEIIFDNRIRIKIPDNFAPVQLLSIIKTLGELS